MQGCGSSFLTPLSEHVIFSKHLVGVNFNASVHNRVWIVELEILMRGRSLWEYFSCMNPSCKQVDVLEAPYTDSQIIQLVTEFLYINICSFQQP